MLVVPQGISLGPRAGDSQAGRLPPGKNELAATLTPRLRTDSGGAVLLSLPFGCEGTYRPTLG